MPGSVEHASGKGRGEENFPVGSFLIRADLRSHVHCFYRFARNADDIADATDLPPAEKMRRLDLMASLLDGGDGDGSPSSLAMRQSLNETGVSPVHCHELLDAFRLDTHKNRYADWSELMGYCRLSAATVGRYMLDLHGESQDCWPASDALCSALQVINHLQDCQKDYQSIDRVYLPVDWIEENGCRIDDLAAPSLNQGLRLVLDNCLHETSILVKEAEQLPGLVRQWGLKVETAVIISLANRLVARLRRDDPLARRVELGKGAIAVSFLRGFWEAYW